MSYLRGPLTREQISTLMAGRRSELPAAAPTAAPVAEGTPVMPAVATARRIPLQVGTTNGGNDGSAFAPYGVPDVPLGWPLRYSHTPVETIDLRDVANLANLVQAVAEQW